MNFFGYLVVKEGALNYNQYHFWPFMTTYTVQTVTHIDQEERKNNKLLGCKFQTFLIKTKGKHTTISD